MRAFLNLIFFTLILACGLAAGYLAAKAGVTIPSVTAPLDAIAQNQPGAPTSQAQLEEDLDSQRKITSQLDQALKTVRQEKDDFERRNQQLTSALAQARASENSGSNQARVNDLIEQNQYLTDELTAIMTEKADVEAQLAASQSVPVAGAATGSGDQALRQQIETLVGERQGMVQNLNQALQQRDTALEQTQTLQEQLQTIVARLQDQGINLNTLLSGQPTTAVTSPTPATPNSGFVSGNVLGGN